jgi:hypothetical protein
MAEIIINLSTNANHYHLHCILSYKIWGCWIERGEGMPTPGLALDYSSNQIDSRYLHNKTSGQDRQAVYAVS